MRPAAGAAPMDICPSAFGGRNWAHAAYHPGTGLVYLPSMELCWKYSLAKDIEYKRGALYIGADFTVYAPQDQVGVVRAINPAKGETVGGGGPGPQSRRGVFWRLMVRLSSQVRRTASWWP